MPVQRRRPRSAARAFTLMELLIVIAILLALMAIVAGYFLGVQDQADADLQSVQLDLVDDAMDRFYLDLRRYPSEEEGLAVLWDETRLENEEDLDRWRGPYLEEPVTEDPWGSEYVYYQPSQLTEEGDYDIISFGPDREEGTADDITNHDGSVGEEGAIGGEEDFSVGGGSGT